MINCKICGRPTSGPMQEETMVDQLIGDWTDDKTFVLNSSKLLSSEVVDVFMECPQGHRTRDFTVE